ncbi:immune inhibitor A domain-containing protein [Calidifontibacter indicus]|uniref:immune inhibitor A domain-containing protein n=1 Tax=Calidifontibacter indicus TaxID=419650 RepID=UPI003D761A2D
MNRRMLGALAGTTAALTAIAGGGSAAANPATGKSVAATTVVDAAAKARPDNLPDPMHEAQSTLRETAVNQVVAGTAQIKTINGKRVIEMQAPESSADARRKGGKDRKPKKGKYVQYDVNREASIFTVLAQFGTQTKPAQGGTAGPKVNEIPQPDRRTDNSTYWEPDFNRAHYQNMVTGSGESMKSFYKAQSLGRFNVTGDVTDWVTVPYNEARYGHNPVAGDGTSQAEGYWSFIGDSLTAWYNSQKAAGKTDAQIKQYLAQFDKWDRYDYDGDGNFDEPDGYIDHFQAIHAGEGEEAGGGAQGEDAIWSHRWAVQTGTGRTGPDNFKAGGVQIGNTGIWVRDYTTEPENGGLGVFTHEFGHDLGLPDLYDTAGGDNSTAFWSLMSSGSWLNHGKDSIGTTPGYMGAWEKIYLGWADVKTVQYTKGTRQTVTTGPADLDDRKLPQVVAISLPDKNLVTNYNTPKTGTMEWWSGRGDDLNNSLTRDIDLTGATTASVSTAIAFDIETDYDFLNFQVSTDGGSTWNDVAAPLTGKNMTWSTKSIDLSAYKGQKIKFRFNYATDGGVNEAGAFLDDIVTTIDGVATTEGAESTTSAWTATGFSRINGSTSVDVPRFYLAEYRRYSGYDKTLKTGPYNFGFSTTRPDWVEHYPYQDGLLITYSDGQYADNNVSAHPGYGQVLPVDAHPAPLKWSDGTIARNRIQSFDSTFGTKKTDSLTLHKADVKTTFPSQRGNTVFDDTNPNQYWFESNPQASTKVAGSGTSIKVQNQTPNSMKLVISFK